MLAGGTINSPTVSWRSGAPQSVYSDHLLQTRAIDGAIGYKLEAPPTAYSHAWRKAWRKGWAGATS